MKIKLILITAALIILSQPIFPKTVDLSSASKVAINFYYERVNQYRSVNYKDIKIQCHKTYKENGITLYYTFFIQPGGFIIVSANDRIQPVLGYSFEGDASNSEMPPAMSERMKIYCKQIKYVFDNCPEIDKNINDEWKRLSTDDISLLKPFSKKSKSVDKLLTSTWDQDNYYNEACPVDPAGPGGHALAGCVATAIGQIMYYYRWPEQGTGSYTYYHPVYDTLSADFGNTTYRWNEMTDNITASNPAIAELLFHIGVSVDMNYGPNGSGMYNHKAGYIYRTYFNYVPETHYIFRDSTNIDWDSVLVHHLDRKMPLYYAGWTADSLVNISGHAFVCDGYQDTNYFHFNWGWNGIYNGYFYLHDLSPGGSSFNYGHEVVANIFPDTINYNYPSYCQGITDLISVEGTIEDGSGPVNNYQNNADCLWLIAPQDPEFDSITKIKLKFIKFDTETGADSVIIYDGPTTNDAILGSYSGNTLPPNIYSTTDKMLVRFVSNNNITSSGWLASYESVFPVYCGSQVLTALHDTLSDGSGIKRYSNNTMCNWFINPPNAKSITLHFTEFQTEHGYDFLSIFDPSTTPSTLLAKYSGDTVPPPVTSNSGKMFLTFFTNGNTNGQGWTAYYDTILTTAINERIVFSKLSIYPNPTDDVLNISFTSDQAQEVHFEIIDFGGRIVINNTIKAKQGQNNHSLITSDFSSGIYYLRITGHRGVINKKLVIE